MKLKNYQETRIKKVNSCFSNKKPRFSLIFIYIVSALLIAVILWSVFSIKTYVVKASGVVGDQYKENIMNYTTGEIKKIYVKEGDKVNKGDKIIEIDSFHINFLNY